MLVDLILAHERADVVALSVIYFFGVVPLVVHIPLSVPFGLGPEAAGYVHIGH